MATQTLKNWKKMKFADFVDTAPKSILEKSREYPFIPMELIDGVSKYPTSSYKKKFSGGGSRFMNGDTIFARITPCLENGKIAQIKNLPGEVGFGSTEFFVFRSKEGISDKDFIYYLSRTEKVRSPAIKSMIGASGRQRADKAVVENLEILVPSILEQRDITQILSTYDSLIENNTRRIQILEQMAQAVYTEWFVNFRFPNHEKVKMIDSSSDFGKIPKGWVVKKLGEKIDIYRGKNITKKTIKEGNVPVVAGGLEPAYYHRTANTKAPVVTVSASGANAGFVNLYMENVWASDCSYIDKSITPFVFFYFLLLKSRQVEVTGLQRGSAQPHVYSKDLSGLLIADAPDYLIENFERIIDTLFSLIGNLKRQNKKLRDKRDLLLPKLVNGEIRV